jgi:hypothetical protein
MLASSRRLVIENPTLTLLALEYLAESAVELRYGLLRDILEHKLTLTDDAFAQILSLLPPEAPARGIDAIDVTALQLHLRTVAAAYAATHGLSPMLGIAIEVDEHVRASAARAVDTAAMIARCADYARRAQHASPEAQAQAIARLASELTALSVGPFVTQENVA